MIGHIPFDTRNARQLLTDFCGGSPQVRRMMKKRPLGGGILVDAQWRREREGDLVRAMNRITGCAAFLDARIVVSADELPREAWKPEGDDIVFVSISTGDFMRTRMRGEALIMFLTPIGWTDGDSAIWWSELDGEYRGRVVRACMVTQ